MTRTLSLLLIASLPIHICIAQQATAKPANYVKPMIMPDEHTVLINDKGDTITNEQLYKLMAGGGYTLEPTLENNQIKNIRLRPNGKKLEPGSIPPDFTASDLSGKTYNLQSLKGKIVVLDFWFTHCVGCIEEMPALNQLVHRYKNDSNVVFLAITFDDSAKVNGFLTQHAFAYPIAAGKNDIIAKYGIQIFPFNIIIDKNGYVAHAGASGSSQLSSIIDGLEK